MALQSSDFQNLKLSMDDVTKASRDLVAALQKLTTGQIGASSGGGTGSGGTVGPNGLSIGAGGGASFLQGGGSAAGAPSVAVNSARQLLGSISPGAGQFAGALGGAPGALAGAASGIGAQMIQDSINMAQRPGQSKLEAFANAPANESEGRAIKRARLAGSLSRIDAESEADRHNVLNALGGAQAGQDLADREIGRAYEKRELLKADAAENGPEDRALARTKAQLDRYARGGGFQEGPAGDEGRHLFDQLLERNRRRERNQQNAEKWMSDEADRTRAGAPGTHGRFNGR